MIRFVICYFGLFNFQISEKIYFRSFIYFQHAPKSCYYSGKVADKEDSYVLLDICSGLRYVNKISSIDQSAYLRGTSNSISELTDCDGKFPCTFLFTVASRRFINSNFAFFRNMAFNVVLLKFGRGSIEDGVKRYNLVPIERRQVTNALSFYSTSSADMCFSQLSDCLFYHHSMDEMLDFVFEHVITCLLGLKGCEVSQLVRDGM